MTWRPHFFRYFIAVSLALYPAPAKADLIRLCTSLVAGILSAPPNQKPPPELFIDNPEPEFRERLRAVATKIRKEQAVRLHEVWPEAANIGSRVKHEGADLVITSVLGAGNEGVVYIAKDSSGKEFVLKKFTDASQNNASHVRHYRQLWAEAAIKTKTAVPGYYSFDFKNQTMLTSFVDGIPVDAVITKGKKYGLSDDDVSKVKTLFRKHVDTDGDNYVIDLAGNGRVYRIDAY